MINTFLHLGSNQGNPLQHLLRAIGLLESEVGPILYQSSFYKTQAWGLEEQADFINLAIQIETHYSALDLLKKTQQIENEIGTEKEMKWGPRRIDIDILYYGDQIYNGTTLVIPHPHISQRNFVLVPLMEIAQDFVDPVLQKTIEELYLASRDKCEVILL